MTISRGFKEMDAATSADMSRKVFIEELRRLKLTAAQIEGQSLSELEESLKRCNQAIDNAHTFGSKPISVGGNLAQQAPLPTLEVSILPALLDSKKLILNRIRRQKEERQIEDLRGLIKGDYASVEDLQENLDKQLEQIETETKELHSEAAELERATLQEQLDAEERIARWELEVSERRAKIWQSFLQRESVATIIGACILLVLTVALVITIFVQIETPDIFNNAFLLILGYFFGQAASKMKAAD